MSNAKENLQNLLKLVKELSSREELEWFKKDLKDHFNSQSNKNITQTANNDLAELTYDLRRTSYYLRNIDRKIWTEGLKFYSEISNSMLRISLLKDFRFMKIADHENDFLEYTRRVDLQLENCLNYICLYLDAHQIISTNPNKFTDSYNNLHVGNYSFFFNNGSPKELEKIGIYSKAFFAKTFYQFSYDYKAFDEMTKLRNLSSHGGAISEDKIINILGEKYVVAEKKANFLKCYLSFYKKMSDLFY